MGAGRSGARSRPAPGATGEGTASTRSPRGAGWRRPEPSSGGRHPACGGEEQVDHLKQQDVAYAWVSTLFRGDRHWRGMEAWLRDLRWNPSFVERPVGWPPKSHLEIVGTVVRRHVDIIEGRPARKTTAGLSRIRRQPPVENSESVAWLDPSLASPALTIHVC